GRASAERLLRRRMERLGSFGRVSVPLVLDGLLDEQAGPTNWSLPLLRERFGDRQVSVILTTDGRLRGDVQRGLAFETVLFGDYIDRLEQGEQPEAYLAAPTDTWLPEVLEDIAPPQYCRNAGWRNSRFWLSA